MKPAYEYHTMNASHYPSLHAAANECAKEGWRTVAVLPSRGPGYADTLLLERQLMDFHVPSIIIKQDHRPGKKRRWWNPRSW